jgi:choline kinase
MSNEPAIIILAAGRGSRLGGNVPKPLTELSDGRTILQQQLENIVAAFGVGALKRTFVVVGYKLDEIVEALPYGVKAIYNADWDVSNTSKSVLHALKAVTRYNGAIWMNGDVVFSPLVLGRAMPFIEQKASFMAVVEGQTADEEMKYSLDEDGTISKVSKENTRGVGEAVGINYVAPQDSLNFMAELARVEPNAYFYAVEIDFAEDLVRANSVLDGLAEVSLEN